MEYIVPLIVAMATFAAALIFTPYPSNKPRWPERAAGATFSAILSLAVMSMYYVAFYWANVYLLAWQAHSLMITADIHRFPIWQAILVIVASITTSYWAWLKISTSVEPRTGDKSHLTQQLLA